MLGDEEAINRAVFNALAVSLNLYPESNDASKMIIRSWSDHQPPQADRESDLVFFDLSPDQLAPMFTERSVVNRFHAVYRFIPFHLTLIFYGPRCGTLAFRVRENIFVDGSSKPLSILRKAGIYPQPVRHTPTVVYEEEDGFYRKRADLVLPVWVLDNSAVAAEGALGVDIVDKVPDIIIERKE